MKRLVIDRLDLDLRGVSPLIAHAVARLLGPALARAMRGRYIDAAPDHQIDAGRIRAATAPEPGVLASQIAERIAHKTSPRRMGRARVGWVERSETHHWAAGCNDGFRLSLYYDGGNGIDEKRSRWSD